MTDQAEREAYERFERASDVYNKDQSPEATAELISARSAWDRVAGRS
jgi:hypothetical protein